MIITLSETKNRLGAKFQFVDGKRKSNHDYSILWSRGFAQGFLKTWTVDRQGVTIRYDQMEVQE